MYADRFPPAELHQRPADYQLKTWDYDSICAMRQQAQQDDKHSKQSSLQSSLKKRVRRLLLEEEEELATRLKIIDQLQSLGVAYHFEEEIRSILMSMHVHHAQLQLKHDLSSTALLFRMLRGHGISASIDMLSAFRDENGDFKAANPKDIDAFVALHEASYLAFPGEPMLDEARSFAVKKLEELMPSMSISMGPASQTERQGDLPLHWKVPRLQATWSLKQHRYNDERSIDHSILQLAAVDFNLVQAVHGAELVEVTKWWKETGLGEKLPFARDRLVECFFCATCIAPEPCLAGCRELLAKVGSLIVHLDDVYDLYGTFDELAAFTDAVGSWDDDALSTALPEYMKAMYSAIRSTSTEAADRVMKEQGRYDVLPLYKKAWHELCKAFLIEAKWQHEGQMPCLEEYLENGWVTSTGPLLLLHAFTMLQQQEQIDSWLRNHDDGDDMVYPKLVELCSMIFRLCNDCATHEAESERGEAASVITCRMGGGASKEEARAAVADAIAETWKKVNREVALSSSTGTGSTASLVCVNLARTIQCIYQDGDGITSPKDSRKQLVKDMLFTPVDLDIFGAH
ncbi:alpha-terpineol synthase, chloroplastic-like [Triticum dicoccoides]|uniref:alpha-terpineol synthase, chloroplastic-like n=1 Tax=Triticum dicoccoides TaxID=85692 RepID=UPI001890EE54|nr:alpha-terpineol synthase, chloroplastic-like [Triticum dicoccoides]